MGKKKMKVTISGAVDPVWRGLAGYANGLPRACKASKAKRLLR